MSKTSKIYHKGTYINVTVQKFYTRGKTGTLYKMVISSVSSPKFYCLYRGMIREACLNIEIRWYFFLLALTIGTVLR